MTSPPRSSNSPALMARASEASSVNPRPCSAPSTAPSVSSSSSRSTIRSTLAATRAWKSTCPVDAARTSLSRKSATAATSSAAVGRLDRGLPVGALRASRKRCSRPSAPDRRSSRSHSVSLTRRPIAISSTDRVAPERCRSAWFRQMTPYRSVAMVCHHRNASRSTTDVASCSYARRKASTLPSPPAPSVSGAPNRHALIQNQARSS